INDMEMREQIERVESDRQSRNRVCFDPHPYGAARTEKTSPQHTARTHPVTAALRGWAISCGMRARMQS
ncbi:MAG: hypothetical protein ACM32G_03280, partial [Betaproteobacteria bacterium]